jgi:hypothetical protein
MPGWVFSVAGFAVLLAVVTWLGVERAVRSKRSDVNVLARASIEAAAALLSDRQPSADSQTPAVRATAQALLALLQDLPVRVRQLEADTEALRDDVKVLHSIEERAK